MSSRRCRILKLATLTLTLITVGSCEPGYAVWVIAGSTARHLVFGLATERNGHKTRPLLLIEVDECNRIAPDLRETHGQVLWRQQGTDASGSSAVSRAVYGEPIPGLRDSVHARPLTPGCFYAWVAVQPGLGRVTFWVDQSGAVRDPTQTETDSMYAIADRRGVAELADADSAIARCKRAYADAPSSVDSNHVDGEALNDTAHLGRYTCGWYRQYYRSEFERR